MYSIPPVYGQKQFDMSNIPTSMYSLKPYYRNDGNGSNGSNKTPTIKIDPLPTDPPVDFQNNHDARLAVEDLISRQLLLLCRLNDIEKSLIFISDVINQSGRELSDLKPNLADCKNEDIVVHFFLDNPPFTLLTVLSVLTKKFANLILVNLHLHSSLNGSSCLKSKTMQLTIKKLTNFQFNGLVDNTKRTNCPLTFTFIGKNMKDEADNCQAYFKSNQPKIVGELNIIRKLSSIIVQQHDQTESFWDFLCNANMQSMQWIECLGQYLVGLNDKKFLYDSEQPRLIDLVAWCLTKKSPILQSLMDTKWAMVIQAIINN